MIQNLAGQFPVRRLCSLLEVSPSGYYQWCQRTPSPRARANQKLLRQIQKAFDQSRQTYGSPRITHCLKRKKLRCSENRVARLMREHQLQAKSKRPFRPRTTDSRHPYGAAPNELKKTGPLKAINQAWVADITYIATDAGWVYLAAIMDLYSRKIVGWSLGCSLHTSLVKEALQQAWTLRRPAAGLLHHSDRGSQYASSAFRALLLDLSNHPQHEPARQLLRQRRHGILLEHSQNRTHPSPILHQPTPGLPRHRPLHLCLLQHSTPPQRFEL